ncbi:MAG: PEP-CTERM/exosortase system-associated acyltransferase [Stellaceae bacterium]
MSLVASTKPISRILPFTRTENRTSELFNRYLSVVPADTPSLLDQAFRLRFQVYCVERGFENPTDYPDGRERDRDDDRSLHSLLIDRATCSAVGTVRLILPRGRDELPVFGVIGPRERSVTRLPSETTAEVSRFAVAKSFRRQIEHGWYSHSGSTTIAGRVRTDVTQLLTFGLIRAVVMMSAFGGITHIVGMMEPTLLRLLGRLGIAFHPLGERVEHHGIRQPGWAVMKQLIASIKNCHPELGEVITDPRLRNPSLAVDNPILNKISKKRGAQYFTIRD